MNTKILLHIEEKVASTITQERKITANTDTSKVIIDLFKYILFLAINLFFRIVKFSSTFV